MPGPAPPENDGFGILKNYQMNGDQMQVKKCANCNKVKPVDDFEKNQYSPDGRYLICKVCFDQRLKGQLQPESEVEHQKMKKSDIADPVGGVEKKPSKSQAPARTARPVKTITESKNNEAQIKDIKHAQQEVLTDTKDVSLQAQGLLPKLRKCNSCKKIEPVGKAPLVPPKTVQAWFCKECLENKRYQYIGKGYLVYDYWGRIYKVTRVLNNEVVRGVVKKGDGRWSNKKFNIYGRWLTKKPL